MTIKMHDMPAHIDAIDKVLGEHGQKIRSALEGIYVLAHQCERDFGACKKRIEESEKLILNLTDRLAKLEEPKHHS